MRLYGAVAGILALSIAGFAAVRALTSIDSNIITVTTPPSQTGYRAQCAPLSTSTIFISWNGNFTPPAIATLYGSNTQSALASAPKLFEKTGSGDYTDSGLAVGAQRFYRVDTKLADGTAITGSIFSCYSLSPSSDTPTLLGIFANSPSDMFFNWKDNATSTSPYHFEVQKIRVTPNMPTSTATTSPGVAADSVPLTWTVSATSTPYYTAIERSTSTTDRFTITRDASFRSFSTGDWDPLLSGNPHTFTYTDTSVEDATTYYYRFKTCSSIPIGGFYATSLSGKEQLNPATTKPSPACSAPQPSDAGMMVRTPPLAPTNLTATAVSDSAIDLAWTNRSRNATGYVIERSVQTENNYSFLASVGNNTTSYRDSGLAAGTIYYYRIRAYKNFGGGVTLYSDWAFSGSATTNFDVMVTVTGGDGSVSSDPSGINKCTSACSAVFPSGTSVTLTATSTKASSTFSFWNGNWCNGSVDPACTMSGNANVEALFNTSTPPSAAFSIPNPQTSQTASGGSKTVSGASTTSGSLQPPTNLQGAAISPLAVRLTWNPVPGADGYSVIRGGSQIALTLNPLWYDNQGVGCGGTYVYAVESFLYGPNGTVGTYSAPSPSVAVPVSCTSQPTVSVTAPNGGSYKAGSTLVIQWNATGITSNANSIAVSVYKVRADNNYFGVAPDFGVTWYNTVSANGIILDTGSYTWAIPSTFAPGQYVVQVAIPYGLKAYSAPFSITSAQASLLEAAGSIRDVVVGSITAAWNTLTDGVQTLLSWFRARVPVTEGKTGSSIDYDAYFAQSTSTTPVPSWKDKGLLPDTVYLYRVRVVYDSGQNSPWSQMIAGKTLGGNESKLQGVAGVCINNSYCEQRVVEVPNYQHQYLDPNDPTKMLTEHSESQCTVNADCRNVGRSSQIFEER